MHPRTGRQRAYWACAGKLAKVVTAPAAMTISTDWRMACSLEVFRATLMYERGHAPFKAPDCGMIGPEMRFAGRQGSSVARSSDCRPVQSPQRTCPELGLSVRHPKMPRNRAALTQPWPLVNQNAPADEFLGNCRRTNPESFAG